MASIGKLSYKRLRNEEEIWDAKILEREVKKAKAWLKLRALAGAGRRRPRLRITGLKRFLKKRTKFVSRVRVSWRMALKKLKNGQSHWNDLFGNNFLFMQQGNNPSTSPFGCTSTKKPHFGYGVPRLSTT